MITVSEDPALVAKIGRSDPRMIWGKKLGTIGMVGFFAAYFVKESAGAPWWMAIAGAVLAAAIAAFFVLEDIDDVDADSAPQSLVFDSDAIRLYAGPKQATIPWDAVRSWDCTPDADIDDATWLTLHVTAGNWPSPISVLLSPSDLALAREALKDV